MDMKELIAKVADGMGGHKAGDIASRLTVDSVVDKLSKVKSKDYISVITDTIIKVNKEVIDKAAVFCFVITFNLSFISINQSKATLIYFFFFVNYGKNTFSAGKRI